MDLGLYDLPVSTVHDARLRKILKHRDHLGGVAAGLLLDIHGVDIKSKLIDEMFQHSEDYNFCTEIGRALQPYVDTNDLAQVFNRFQDLSLHHMKGRSEVKEIGLLAGCAQMFSMLNSDDLLKVFLPWHKLNPAQLSLLHEFLSEKDTPQMNSLKVELIKHGDREAIFPLNLALIGNERREAVSPIFFDKEVVAVLIDFLASDKKSGEWSIDILEYVCEVRFDLSDIVKEAAAKAKGILRLILLYCYRAVDENSFWNEISRLAFEGVAKKDRKFLPFFSQFEINWADRTDILLRLLKRRDKGLAHAILSTLERVGDNQHWAVALEPLEWWIDFLRDEEAYNVIIYGSSFRSSLRHFIAFHATSETHRQLITMFNQTDYVNRRILADYVLGSLPGMTTDLLSHDATNFLIDELKRPYENDEANESMPLLAYISTEEFVEKYLLPLLECEEEPLKTNLYAVLSKAGERHRRRYILDF